MRNWFYELSQVDVSEHIEKKNGLSYLSWAWAWSELKTRFPLSYNKTYEHEDGSQLWLDPVGAHVKTSVTIVWEEEDGLHEFESIMTLPVMDMRNKSIPAESIDSMALNKTIQRCMTKCIAMLGLGVCIYAGQDLPEESVEVKAEKAAKKAAAEAEARDVVEMTAKIDTIVKEIVSDMTPDEKKAFAASFVTPIVGTANYKTCRDLAKLTKLHDNLSDALKTKKDAAA